MVIKIKGKVKNEDNRKAFRTGIIGGIIASLCCISPIVIILLGLGSVSFALSFSKYKIYFLAASFIFVITASALYLREKSKHCKINLFSKEGIKREKNFFIIVATIMIAIYFSMNYVISPQISSLIFSSYQKENSSENLRLLTLQISGLTCPGCATGLEYLFRSLDGVIRARVYFPSGKAEVVYDQTKITKEKIISAQTFYKTKIIDDTKISSNSVGELEKYKNVDKNFIITSLSYGYDPSKIEVKKGDVIRIQLMNFDSVNHSLVIDEYNIRLEVPAYGGSNKIAEAVFTANKPGIFNFYDPLYSNLRGEMIVS